MLLSLQIKPMKIRFSFLKPLKGETFLPFEEYKRLTGETWEYKNFKLSEQGCEKFSFKNNERELLTLEFTRIRKE